MYQDRVVLCASSAYEKKFWFNEDFAALPEQVKQELKIMCVLFTEDVGGILSMEFSEDGTLLFRVDASEDDFLFDEIGSALKVKELQRTKKELLEAVEIYYRVFFLDQDASGLLSSEDRED
ncbi:MAG: hypothetical protein E7255_07300 [Lachnospiraceae bacterium]|jgi:hypothetical protein|nr:hypothetical protein [Lachnospiraceae bacterium]